MHACFSIRMLLILYERTFETLLISPQSFHINLGNKILTSHYHLGHVGRHRRLRPWLALWITKVKNGLFFFAWSKWCRVLRVRKSFVACFSMTQGLNMPRCKTFTLIRVLSSSTGDNQGKHQEPTLFGECLGFLWPTTQTEISQHGTGDFPQIVIGLMESIITPSIITWDSGSKFIVLCQRNLILWTSLEVSKVKTDFNNNYYRKVRNQRKVGN